MEDVIRSIADPMAGAHAFGAMGESVGRLAVGSPDDPLEKEASRMADRAGSSPLLIPGRPGSDAARGTALASGPDPAPAGPALLPGGTRLPDGARAVLEWRFGADFGGVRVHAGPGADQAARAVGARAFAVGEDVVFRAGEFNPDSVGGRHVLAHELAHVMQGRRLGRRRDVVRRETAREITERYTDWGGLNLQEEELAAYLVAQARSGNYALVTSVISFLPSADRDDVAGEMVGGFSTRDLIRMARNADAVAMLRLMRDELGDYGGWITRGEQHQVSLLGAVLDEPGDRDAWNRERIAAIKGGAGSDLDALARVFEDDEIIDDGTVSTRLQSISRATAHLVIPGLQTGIEFSDTGFAGDQEPGGAGFRDPHPSSRNQPGHFLTAVGLQFSPETVSRPIPNWEFFCAAIEAPRALREANTIRAMVGAPATATSRSV